MSPAASSPRERASATSKLATYRAKRDPKKTPEPMGRRSTTRSKKGETTSFIIQEHHARALHWDFRLERDGVLVSWALPKGLPLDPHVNHLAIHTEDHPLDYASFEGQIPKGEYGAGDVTIWDRGTYDTEKWRDKEVMVVLHGARVSGRYVLFPTDDDKWMIHRMDGPATNYETMPEHVTPMLAEAGEIPYSSKDWAYEFKWDGVRAVVYIDGGRVRALTRNDKNLVSTFPELRALGPHLGSRSAILDGEIVTLDNEGRPSFARLSKRLHLASPSAVERIATTSPASFLAFDVLYLDGTLLLGRTYDERRAILDSLDLHGNEFETPPSITNGTGDEILRIAEERGLEGVVIKRRKSRYSPGARNGDWIKVKYIHTQEVVLGGWTAGRGERHDSLGALLLGVNTPEGLSYIGKVGTGFSADARRELLGRLTPLERKTSPFLEALSRTETALAHFVRPQVVGEVRFAEWTKDGRLRHPSWLGLRKDKDAHEVVREP